MYLMMERKKLQSLDIFLYILLFLLYYLLMNNINCISIRKME